MLAPIQLFCCTIGQQTSELFLIAYAHLILSHLLRGGQSSYYPAAQPLSALTTCPVISCVSKYLTFFIAKSTLHIWHQFPKHLGMQSLLSQTPLVS